MPVVALALLGWSAQLDTADAQPRSVLETDVASLRRWTGEPATVSVTGTVAYSDPLWRFVFLTDDGAGIFLHQVDRSFAVGDRIRVVGVVQLRHGHPTLGAGATAELLGHPGLPEPPRHDLAGWSAEAGLDDARAASWLELAGRVEQIDLYEGSTRLWCRDRAGVLFPADTPEAVDEEAAWGLIGADVVLRGALGLLLDDAGAIGGPLLMMQDRSHLRVDAQAERPPSAHRHPEGGEHGAEVFHAFGQVSLIRGDRFFYESGVDAVAVRAANTWSLQVQQLVSVMGRREGDAYVAEVIRPWTTRSLPPPDVVTPRAIDDSMVARRVQTAGKVAGFSPSRRQLYLRAGESLLRVQLPEEGDLEALDLGRSKRVEVTGVVLPEREHGQRVIAVARPEDLRVLEQHFRLSTTYLLTLLVAVAAAIGLAFLWALVLRRQVEQRTAELRVVNAQLLQAQKMEAIGRLAGGLAHDFNNLLTAVIGNIQLARTTAEGPEVKDQSLADALNAAKRAASIVRQLLTFSRQQDLRRVPTDPRTLLRALEPLLRHGLPPTIRLVLDADDAGLRTVLVDPVQIEQVLLNLCLNARDAMADGGRLTVRCAPGNLGGEPAVVFTVSDEGSGMPPDVQARVFEPFFTTKPAGQGTGLGLATSFGIVQQHRGTLECESEVGAGTTFRVTLPAAAERAPVAAMAPSVWPDRPDGRRSLLLIDDEPLLLRTAKRILASQGYAIHVAEGGAEGLAVLDAHADAIDLVLLDISMPDMDGYEVLRRIRAERPALPVILSSGQDPQKDEMGEAPDAFLAKPFTHRKLLHAVRDTLARAAPPS